MNDWKVSRKNTKSLEAVIYSCSTDMMFWTLFQEIPRKMSLELRPATVINIALLFYRSSRWSCSVRKGVLRNFAKFTGKHLAWGLQLYLKWGSITGVFLWILQILKKRLYHWCFPVNFAKNTSGRLSRNFDSRVGKVWIIWRLMMTSSMQDHVTLISWDYLEASWRRQKLRSRGIGKCYIMPFQQKLVHQEWIWWSLSDTN